MTTYIERRHLDIINSLLPKPTSARQNRNSVKHGSGILNRAIDKLPIPLHLPGYNYAGPGTPLQRNLELGIKPINKLDEHAMYHDMKYDETTDTKERSIADRILENQSWERVKAKDASLGERANAWLVMNAMKLKRITGQGVGQQKERKYIPYPINVDGEDQRRLLDAMQHNHRHFITITVRNQPTKDAFCNKISIPLTNNQLRTLRKAANRNADVRLKISRSQLDHMSQTGGLLPAIPAVLAAAPAIAAIASTIFKTYNDKKTNDRLIEERIRHNKVMEAKTTDGSGVYLRKKPVSIGEGIYLNKRRSGKGINMPKNDRKTRGNGLLQQLLKKKTTSLE